MFFLYSLFLSFLLFYLHIYGSSVDFHASVHSASSMASPAAVAAALGLGLVIVCFVDGGVKRHGVVVFLLAPVLTS